MKGFGWYIGLAGSIMALRYLGQAAAIAQFGPLVQEHVRSAPMTASDVGLILTYVTTIVGVVLVGARQRAGVLVTRLGVVGLFLGQAWSTLGFWVQSESASSAAGSDNATGQFLQAFSPTAEQWGAATAVLATACALQLPLVIWSYVLGSTLLLRMYDHGWTTTPQTSNARPTEAKQDSAIEWDAPPSKPRSPAQEAQLAIARARATAAPTDAASQAELARVLEQANNLREAEVQWHKVLLLEPRNSEAAVALHRLALPADKPAALQRLGSMAALHPEDAVLRAWQAELEAQEAEQARTEASARDRAARRAAEDLKAAEEALVRDQALAVQQAKRRRGWLIGGGAALVVGTAATAWFVEDTAQRAQDAENRLAQAESGELPPAEATAPAVDPAIPAAQPTAVPAAGQAQVPAQVPPAVPTDKLVLRIPHGNSSVAVFAGMAESELRQQVKLEEGGLIPDALTLPAGATLVRWTLSGSEDYEGQEVLVALSNGQVQQVFVPSVDSSGITQLQTELVAQIERVAGPANGDGRAFWRVPGGTAARVCTHDDEDHYYCYVLLRG